ncbi:type II secretion system protein [Bdellovibrio bacteriovorus]|nr:type II secretion system protein [Bdellovibrio bacteriovorus]
MSSQQLSKKQSGFSLVEMLIGLTIVGGVFAILYNFGRMNAQRVSSESITACEQIARSSLDNLRSFGLERTSANINREANLIGPPDGTKVNSTVIRTEDAWGVTDPSRILLDRNTPPNQPSTSNFHLNTIGTMSTLAKLYSTNPTYCSGSVPYPGNLLVQGGIANGGNDRFQSVNTTLKIQSYQLSTGQIGCHPFYPVPASADASPTAGGTVRLPPEASSDYGFWVTVNTSYAEANGKTGSCTASSLFQYPAKRRPSSSSPSGFMTASDPGGPGVCKPTMTGTTTTIYMPAQSEGKDWVMVCQDASYSSPLSGPSCSGRVSQEPFTVANNAWVDCRQVTLCNEPAANNSVWVSPNEVRVFHSKLKWGCHPRMNVRVVDSAQNLVGSQITITDPNIDSWWSQGPGCHGPNRCGHTWCDSEPYCPPIDPTPPCSGWWCGWYGGGDGGGWSGGGGDGGDGHDGGDGSGGGSDGCD